MAKLTDQHKEERGQYFDFGIHKVQIALVTQGMTEEENPREFFDFNIVDDIKAENPMETTVRLWFHTDKAIGYSFGIVRGIFTHNAPEAKKEAIKKQLQKVDDTDELIKLCEKLVGKECWLQVAEDPSRTYVKDGEEKKSINKNITGYEPKPMPTQVSAPAETAATAPSAKSDEDVMAGF